MPGLTGGKMSSSDVNSYIALTDSTDIVKNKILKYAFSGGRDTVDEHRSKGGIPEIDVSFQYLTYFLDDDKKLKKIHDDYKSGKMLTGELKKITIDVLNKVLSEHQKRREKAKNQIDKFME
jgi:tryptophanyl-tRNA synthetase